MAALLAFTAASLRADEEQDLIGLLQSNAGVAQKCAACQRLRLIGTARAVPALAALLADERTGHAARYALEGLPCSEADAALRAALSKTSGLARVGVVDSLGRRRDRTAVPLLAPLLAEANPNLAAAAATALGRIGGPEALAALIAARDPSPPAVRPAVLESLLQCADQLRLTGDSRAAAALYRDLAASRFPSAIRVAAWRGRVLTEADARAGLVSEALAGTDHPLRAVALKVMRELRDPQLVRAGLDQWAALPEDAQLAVLDAALPLGAEARSAVQAATQSPRPAVRAAAWEALAELGDASFIPALARAAATGEAAERAAARETLARLRGAGVRQALLEELDRAAAPEKAELLRALGERGDTAAASLLVQQAAAETGPARLAALASLKKLALAETLAPLLDLAARAKTEAEREPVLEALDAVCQASPDKNKTARLVAESLGRLPAAERRHLLPLLADLGTADALNATLAALRDSDLGLVKEALRVLAQWPNAAPASPLFDWARASTDPTLRALAWRAGIEVAGQEPDPARRLALLQQALAGAGQVAEKKQALGQIGRIATAEALQVALGALAESGLADEAALAAVSIAGHLAPANPKLAADVAAQVLARCKAPEVVKRAWALRGQLKSAAPFLRDWLVAGPFSQPGVTGALAVFDVAFAPEKPGAAVRWKPVPAADMINLAALFPDQASCAAYLKTTVMAPEAGDAVLLLGSDDGVKAWLNGAVVHSHNVDRGAAPDQDVAPIRLKAGANELLLKVTQGGGGWAVCARIVSPDGLPIAGLKAQAGR